MLRKIFALMLMLTAISFFAKAGYQPVTVTGFTQDVIANGNGPLAGCVTADVDGGNYYFLNQSFTTFGTPTYYLPNSGLINSVNAGTSGLSFQLADASSNNSLRLLGSGTTSGTLTFATPSSAGILYVLATSGGGATSLNITVTFTDNSTQVFTSQSVADWYNASGFAVQGIGRVNGNGSSLDNAGGSSNPRLYQIALAINSSNYTKQVQSVTFERTGTVTAFVTSIMAISLQTVCQTPAAQATSLVLTPANSGQINGSFTAASPAPESYLVVRYPAGSTTVNPVDGTTYSVGSGLGFGTVVQYGAATSFSTTGLTANSQYDFSVYSAMTAPCTGGTGPLYLTSSSLFGTASTPACSGPGNTTLLVGASQTYTTLGAAVTSLASGITGAITIELQSDYVSTGETYPITFPSNACITASSNVTVRPATGATGLQISGSVANPIIDINGGSYITIDGRPGGTGTTADLKIINTSTTGVAMRLVNEASNNTIKYCDIQGQNTATTTSGLSGVLYIGSTSGNNGNDNNSITNNNIHSTTGGTPALCVVAYGSTASVSAYNDYINFSNNNIYDFFIAGSSSAGLKVDVGNNAWTISGNSVYQTANRTFTVGNQHRAFWITPNTTSISNTASGFVITDNYIGGTASQAGGSSYTMGGSFANLFAGMDLSLGLGTASSVQNNTIRNITLSSTSTATAGVFIGIGTANGNIDIGTSTGNTIGSSTATGSISVSNGASGTSFGIKLGGGSTINVSNNTVGGITVSGSSATVSTCFVGIGTSSSAGPATANISNNLVGSNTVANSINMSTTSTSTTGQILTGISIASSTTTSSITNNTIANLNNNHNAAGTTSTTRGIVVTTSASSIIGNTVRNLTSSTLETGNGASCALVGIVMSSTNAAGCNVTGNTIHSLTLTASSTTATTSITGLFYNGTSSVTSNISKNFFHSFDATAANTAIIFTGVDFSSAAANITNNMMRLGIKADGSPITTALTVRGLSSNSSTTTQNIWYNTIYIGGTGVGTTVKPSYAFIRTASSGTYDIKNNIFMNVRSNASTGGKHYGVYLTGASTGITANYNLYQVTGTGGVFAYSGTADVNTYTSGWLTADVNSVTGDPNFIAPTGSSAIVNLHIASIGASAAADLGVPVILTTDIDDDTRSATTPDIGADELYSCVAGEWTGTASTDWSNTANWCDGNIPTASTVVVIPSTATNMPVISSGSYQAASIRLKAGTSITITTGSLTTTDLIVAGTSTLSGAGKLNVTGTLSYAASNATLNASGVLVLKSTMAGTARVNDMTNAGTNTGNNIAGSVTMERYIPGGYRKYRFIGHPFSSMNLTELTDDIDITGSISGSNANGFTATNSNAASAYTFTEANGNGGSTDAGWTTLTSGSSVTSIPFGTGMRVLVRGTKGQSGSLTGGSYTPAAVTLGMNGTLKQGSFTQTLSYTSSTKGWNLVSNPYASNVDWTLVTRTNVDNAVYTYRPTLSGGTYASYVNGSVTNGGSQYIESSSAFFVHANAASPSLGWAEADKVTTEPTNSAFRTNNVITNRISLLLTNNATNNTDEVVVRFGDDKATDFFDREFDAANMPGAAHDLYAIDNATNRYSIYHGSELKNATAEKREVVLGIGNITAGNYSITAKTLNAFTGNNVAYIKDAALNTLTEIADSTVYSFAVTSNTASMENRFSIIFNAKEKPVLPSLNATFAVSVYPNPASNVLNVQYAGLNDVATTSLILVNAEGKTISNLELGKVNAGKQTISIKQLPVGNYTVVLLNGETRQSNKIVKQ